MGGKTVGAKGSRTPGQHDPQNQLWKDQGGSQKAAITGPAWTCVMFSCIRALGVVGLLTVGVEVSLTLLAALGPLFLLLVAFSCRGMGVWV